MKANNIENDTKRLKRGMFYLSYCAYSINIKKCDCYLQKKNKQLSMKIKYNHKLNQSFISFI